MEGGWDGEIEKKGHVKKQIDKWERNTRRQQGGERRLMQGWWQDRGRSRWSVKGSLFYVAFSSFPKSATLIYRGKGAAEHHLR